MPSKKTCPPKTDIGVDSFKKTGQFNQFKPRCQVFVTDLPVSFRDRVEAMDQAIRNSDVEKVRKLLRTERLPEHYLRAALLHALEASAPHQNKDWPAKPWLRLSIINNLLIEIQTTRDLSEEHQDHPEAIAELHEFGKRAAIFAKSRLVPYDTYKRIVWFFGLEERELYVFDIQYRREKELFSAPSLHCFRDEDTLVDSNKKLGRPTF
jgi:hypothetical protein